MTQRSKAQKSKFRARNIQLLSNMQDNQEILEGSQSKLSRDVLNNSFSDLEDNHEDEHLENIEQTTQINISEQPVACSHAIIKQQLHEPLSLRIQAETIHICEPQIQKSNEETHQLSGLVKTKEQYNHQKYGQELVNKQNDKITKEHIQKIKMMYTRSFLGQQKITLSQIKKLKSFLYIPKHGEELVLWGNLKFRTNHTAVSALQRLQHMQNSECSELTVKIKQNFKYLLVLSLCLIIIKVIL